MSQFRKVCYSEVGHFVYDDLYVYLFLFLYYYRLLSLIVVIIVTADMVL